MAARKTTPEEHAHTLLLAETYGSSTAVERATNINSRTFQSRLQGAKAWQRQQEIETRGGTVVPSMDVVEVTDQRDAGGELRGFSVKQRQVVEQSATSQDQPLPNFALKRISSLYGAEGRKVLEWQIQSPDKVKVWDAMRAAAAGLVVELPRAVPFQPPTLTARAGLLLNLYTLTDCHVGMLAWHREGGVDWDLGIAERVLFGCFAAMIERSPPAETCIVNQLGDFLHYDGFAAITPTSGHNVDADSRFQKMVEVSVRLLRRIVDLALMKHARVHVIMAEGNHDLASSVWLRVMFKALYENDARVTVDDSALPYYAYRHGNTMLAFAHGHLKKPIKLPMLFATRFSKMWGDTVKRYGHSGHEHHVAVLGDDGMTWRKHPTLAAADAYSARGGWYSEQAATCFTYHREYGEWGSQTVYPEMLEDASALD